MVDKWCAVVQLAWAYVEWRFARERSAQIRSPADIIRRHRDEHVRAWLTGALQMVLDTGAIEPALALLAGSSLTSHLPLQRVPLPPGADRVAQHSRFPVARLSGSAAIWIVPRSLHF